MTDAITAARAGAKVRLLELHGSLGGVAVFDWTLRAEESARLTKVASALAESSHVLHGRRSRTEATFMLSVALLRQAMGLSNVHADFVRVASAGNPMAGSKAVSSAQAWANHGAYIACFARYSVWDV